ncbi:DUF4907 domain-containing protein [Zobellia nedashkovskayae]|uniref:DUF4907 domain-containing protein n=1 Tax=Zobellia nedashkovskayae TaxID=2779510 RepID=UPI00188BD3F6|nr:DUF4907 domain-containing protein [Zobellia nedashkovskayae]
MKTKKTYFFLTALAVILVYIAFNYSGAKLYTKGLHTEVLQVDEGYGYKILYDDKILVKQDFIPAIQGKKSFESEKEAMLVGNVVLRKIEKGEDPYISVLELKDLKINILD